MVTTISCTNKPLLYSRDSRYAEETSNYQRITLITRWKWSSSNCVMQTLATKTHVCQGQGTWTSPQVSHPIFTCTHMTQWCPITASEMLQTDSAPQRTKMLRRYKLQPQCWPKRMASKMLSLLSFRTWSSMDWYACPEHRTAPDLPHTAWKMRQNPYCIYSLRLMQIKTV